ncbi:MAG: hypothetical protein WA975_15685 [Mesorhizobium sp.]
MAGIAVKKWLVDTAEIDRTEFITHELEEASGAVEDLSDTSGSKDLAVTWQVDVQSRIEKFAQRLADAHILDRPEMHGDVTAAGALAKHRWSEIPAWIAVSRQSLPIKTCL